MGKTIKCKRVLKEFRLDPKARTIVTDDSCFDGKGRATPETIKDHMWSGNLSFEEGYINEHVPKALGYIPHHYKAQVVDQRTGKVIAEYKDPPILAWNTDEVEKYLRKKGKLPARKK